MTVIEQITQTLLLWLTVMSPNPVSVDIWSQPQYLPSVYVIPLTEFQQAICGCTCSLSGVYLGGPDHRIVLGSTDDNLLPIDPASTSIQIHELQHFFRHLRVEVYKEPPLSRKQDERQAYEVQNVWLQFNNIPPVDVDDLTKVSVGVAYGKAICEDGASSKTPNVKELYSLFEPIIFKHEHNQQLRDRYQARARSGGL